MQFRAPDTKARRPRLNREITAREARVVGPEGEMMGVMTVAAAIQKAEEMGVDLVEISPTAEPPVCKIIDYGKYAYQLEKKNKEAKKNQKIVQLKEIKMRPKTDVHDYNFKVKHVREFLEEGDRVKISVKFKGRELSYVDAGYKQLDRVVEDTKDIAKVEIPARMEGRNMHLTLVPTKKN